MQRGRPTPVRGTGRGRIRTRSPSGSRGVDLSPERASTSETTSTTSSYRSPATPSAVSDIASRIDSMEMQSSSSFPRGAKRGSAVPESSHEQREYDELVKSRPEGKIKRGQKGQQIDVSTNYFQLKTLPSWKLHHYDVSFPDKEKMDSIKFKRLVIRTMMEERNIGFMFDGKQLFMAKYLEPQEVKVHKITITLGPNREGVATPPFELTVKYIGLVEPGSPIYIQLYNILMKKCLHGMNLVQMGRHFFDPNAIIKLPAQKLELWPGFITSMRTHENDVLLCVEATHKVIRMDSVLSVIREIEKNSRGPAQAAVKAEFKDTVVMTPYNNKTYHVDDVDYTKTPLSTFERKGVQISFADYYKEKGFVIKDMTQPLLVSNPSRRDLRINANAKPAVLIPELCKSTGLTDAMRSNFTLMKELGKHLHQGPQERAKVTENFMKRLISTESLQKEFDRWGFHFSSTLTKAQGRVLSAEKMVFGTGEQQVDQKGDFTMAFRNFKMFSAVNLSKWVIIVPQRESRGVDNLVRTMSKVANPLDMKVANPLKIVTLPDSRVQSYCKSLVDTIKSYPDLQMLFVILPNNKLETYAAVKKILAVDVGIPSQCFVAKNVESKGLMSIATKVVVQMNAKLGGEPWTVKLPLKGTMFVGYDVYKGGKGSTKGNIGAMVASFSPNFTKYFSTTSTYHSDQEMLTTMMTDLQKCLEAYRKSNAQTLPERIFIYRDGVGDGQIKYVFGTELTRVREALAELYGKYGVETPKLVFIIVTKKINTRLFQVAPNGSLGNPGPGTIVDDVVTLPDRYDFFLISCAARQGTVSPCSYNVLYDESGFDPDRIQLITYKLCHMYFNWSGTIAVPAPCQYAHKLAFLTGMAYGGHANEKLNQLLHFL